MKNKEPVHSPSFFVTLLPTMTSFCKQPRIPCASLKCSTFTLSSSPIHSEDINPIFWHKFFPLSRQLNIRKKGMKICKCQRATDMAGRSCCCCCCCCCPCCCQIGSESNPTSPICCIVFSFDGSSRLHQSQPQMPLCCRIVVYVAVDRAITSAWPWSCAAGLGPCEPERRPLRSTCWH